MANNRSSHRPNIAYFKNVPLNTTQVYKCNKYNYD